jgi:hypothetical protein
MKYLPFILLLVSARLAHSADIEDAKLCKVISPLCKEWSLDMGDPSWKYVTSKKLPNGSTLKTGSAYLVFNTKDLTSETLYKTTCNIRDYFKQTFPLKDPTDQGAGSGGISSNPNLSPGADTFQVANFSSSSNTEFLSFQVRAIPLQSNLVGLILYFSHLKVEQGAAANP